MLICTETLFQERVWLNNRSKVLMWWGNWCILWMKKEGWKKFILSGKFSWSYLLYCRFTFWFLLRKMKLSNQWCHSFIEVSKFYDLLYTQSLSYSFFSGFRISRRAYRFQGKMNFLYLHLKKKISFRPFLVLEDFGGNISISVISKTCFRKRWNLWLSAAWTSAFNGSLCSLVTDFC